MTITTNEIKSGESLGHLSFGRQASRESGLLACVIDRLRRYLAMGSFSGSGAMQVSRSRLEIGEKHAKPNDGLSPQGASSLGKLEHLGRRRMAAWCQTLSLGLENLPVYLHPTRCLLLQPQINLPSWGSWRLINVWHAHNTELAASRRQWEQWRQQRPQLHSVTPPKDVLLS